MKVVSRLLQRVLRLDPPTTRDVVVQRELRIPLPDGVELLADRWAPRTATGPLPVAVLRTPYGRGLASAMIARPLAERGFQVLAQSVRGTGGSGGVLDPMRQEREDGLATLDWVRRQPWFGGTIVLTGFSYLGYVQWAVADRLPPEVRAMVPVVTESALSLEFLRRDGLSLETPFGWGVLMAVQGRRGALLRQRAQARRTAQALTVLPLGRADVAATGRTSTYIQDVLAHDADAPHWATADHRDRVRAADLPISSTGGWFDIFLPGQLRDFEALQSAGHPARLTIGPWAHTSREVFAALVRDTVEFALPVALGRQPPERAPVRLYVMGEQAWRDVEAWPPAGYPPQAFQLQGGGTLTALPPAAGSGDARPDRYRYDPTDPTPAVGGVRMSGVPGQVDNTALEARADVLTYTTAVLDQDVEVIGEVSAQIWFRSSLAHADVFVRLCDVDPGGRSSNVCDGLTSLTDADRLACRTVRLWPTAYLFRRGHRIRVQVSSGAFPRYARNHGTGEPHATAVESRVADQEVHHDPDHRSAIILPVRQAGS